MKQTKTLTRLWVLALAFVIAGCTEKPQAQPVSTQAETVSENLPAISVVVARREQIVENVLVSGLIEPVELVFVQPQIEGQPIQTISVDVGDQVEAQQVLATLSEKTLQLQRSQLVASSESATAVIAQAKAQIVEAKAAQREAIQGRKRTTSLAKRGVVSQASLDSARAQASAATARLSAARQSLKAALAQQEGVKAQIANLDYKLSNTQIKSPVTGIVSARNAQIGAIATAATSPMFELISDGELELRADVDEHSLLRLKRGQPAQIELAGLTKPLSGKVRLIEPTVNRTTRLGRVRIEIDQADQARAGMFAQASVELKRVEAVVLPASAIGSSNQGPAVLRVKDNEAQQVLVQIGARSDARVEILGGISVGDIVVERAGAFVRDGDRIQPVDAATSARAGRNN